MPSARYLTFGDCAVASVQVLKECAFLFDGILGCGVLSAIACDYRTRVVLSDKTAFIRYRAMDSASLRVYPIFCFFNA